MELNLADELILLALDDEKGSLVVDSTYLSMALSGSILLELFLKKKIDIDSKKVKVIDRSRSGDEMIDIYLELITESKKERSLRYWVENFSGKYSKIKRAILDKLIRKSILVEKESKILWIIPNNKYPAQNSRHENQLRKKLNTTLIRNEATSTRDVMLLSLIDSSALTKEVFGKENLKENTKKSKVLLMILSFRALLIKALKSFTT